MSECSYPWLNALAVGTKVLLLCNYVVKHKLMNGSIGTITRIVYDNSEGLRADWALPAYVVVDFLQSTILESDKAFPDKPSTYVPVPTDTF